MPPNKTLQTDDRRALLGLLASRLSRRSRLSARIVRPVAEKEVLMPQDRVSGAAANAWGRDIARRIAATLPILEQYAFAIRIDVCPEEHSGLGSGTALALAANSLLLRLGRRAWR